jgi:hypothetical protein
MEIWIHIVSLIIVFAFTTFYSIHIIMYQKMHVVAKLLAVIVIIAVLYLAGNSNTYLPFLGYCAMPPSLLATERKPDDAHDSLILELDDDVPDGTRVVYWGAMSSKDKNVIKSNPFEAYANYLNSGISIVKNKRAIIYFLCPDKYKVGLMGVLERHIHYRLIKPNSAIISPVYTKYVTC